MFVTMVLVVFAFTIYIVLVDKDLTALLIGILIVVILYGIIRFVGSLSRRVS